MGVAVPPDAQFQRVSCDFRHDHVMRTGAGAQVTDACAWIPKVVPIQLAKIIQVWMHAQRGRVQQMLNLQWNEHHKDGHDTTGVGVTTHSSLA